VVNVRFRVILEFEFIIGIDDPGVDFLGGTALDGLFNHPLKLKKSPSGIKHLG
jgi:hypothetical protein